jgi:hypothetical protein
LIEAAKELFPKKVAKKRTRGPNKKKWITTKEFK